MDRKYQIIKAVKNLGDDESLLDTNYQEIGPLLSLNGCEIYVKAVIPVTDWGQLKLQPFEQNDGQWVKVDGVSDLADKGIRL